MCLFRDFSRLDFHRFALQTFYNVLLEEGKRLFYDKVKLTFSVKTRSSLTKNVKKRRFTWSLFSSRFAFEKRWNIPNNNNNNFQTLRTCSILSRSKSQYWCTHFIYHTSAFDFAVVYQCIQPGVELSSHIWKAFGFYCNFYWSITTTKGSAF